MLEQMIRIILLIILLQKNVLVTSDKHYVIEEQEQQLQQQPQQHQLIQPQQEQQLENDQQLQDTPFFNDNTIISQTHSNRKDDGDNVISHLQSLQEQQRQPQLQNVDDEIDNVRNNFLNVDVVNHSNYHVSDNSEINAVTITVTAATAPIAAAVATAPTAANEGGGGDTISHIINNDNQTSDNIDSDVVRAPSTPATSHTSYQLNNETNSVKIIRKIRNTNRIKEDICSRLCNCNNINKFDLSIECHFLLHKQYILGADYFIPEAAISLTIKLSEKSKLRIDEEIFNMNRVNRILIEGNSNGNEHVELSKNAFKHNAGQYPEIDIYNCYTVIFRERSLNGHFNLNVTNSGEVIVFPYALEKSTFVGYFHNIQDLRMHGKAFSGAQKARMDISLCKVNRLEEINASLNEFKISNSVIEKITKNAFNVMYINSFIFENNKIGVIETEAITEKLFSKYFAISNCRIETIQREAIADSGIDNFLFENNEVIDIKEYAIQFTGNNISFTNNKINLLGYFWLTVKDWTRISIYNNTFGNYNRLNIGKTTNPVECIQERNFITEPQPGSLEATNSFCKLKDISFYHACTCNMEWINILTQTNIKLQSYCRVDDTLKFCFNTSTLNVQKYYDDVCDYSEKQLDCIKNKNLKKIEGEFIKPEDIDAHKNHNSYLYIPLGIMAVVGVLFLCMYIIRRLACGPNSNEAPTSNTITTMTTYSMKNSKSFSNEDRIIINKTLEKMKMTQSPERYEQVYNHTKRLLDENLSETDKVITIGEIVRTLGECENTGEDFVAFTDILYRHLAPKDNNDPVYAEPTAPRPPMTELNDTVDHIYAEPSSVQQPLLTNEYAFPIDKNDKISVYAEPVAHKLDNNRTLVTPYAIGSGITVDQQQPSTSKNLPDILNQNICRQQQLPEYTIPNKKLKKNRYRNENGESSSSGSEYSGSSEITLKIDDIEFDNDKK